MTEEKKILEFTAFCIEMFSAELKVSGQKTALLFDRYGVINYLCENYDVLHTQSRQWLMLNISDFLKNRGYLQ